MTQRVSDYFRMIKFSHSIFALPFAFTAAVIAADGIPAARQILWITVAMVAARSGAMGMNRVIDREIDRLNPRTANREIPRGAVTVAEALFFVIISFAALVFAAAMLNPLCLKLSPVAIGVVCFYSYTKRFTWLSHFFLGLSIAAAPVGAWIAIRGSFDVSALFLGLAVIFWLAGFDVLYALQDIGFDAAHGLYSIPKRFGVGTSLILARIFHAIAFMLLLANGHFFALGAWYWFGMAIVAGLFCYEHALLKPHDLSKLNMAFFNMNGYISLTVFLFTLLEYIS